LIDLGLVSLRVCVRVDEKVHIYGNVVVEDVEAVLASSSAVGAANANAYDKWQAALPPKRPL
jgi:hypothetical protein